MHLTLQCIRCIIYWAPGQSPITLGCIIAYVEQKRDSYSAPDTSLQKFIFHSQHQKWTYGKQRKDKLREGGIGEEMGKENDESWKLRRLRQSSDVRRDFEKVVEDVEGSGNVESRVTFVMELQKDLVTC